MSVSSNPILFVIDEMSKYIEPPYPVEVISGLSYERVFEFECLFESAPPTKCMLNKLLDEFKPGENANTEQTQGGQAEGAQEQ